MNTLNDFGSQPRSRFGTLLTLSGIVLLLDRLSKWWILRHFTLGESRPFSRFFSLTFVENTGTAFGFLQNNNGVLLILGIIILGSMLYGARGFYERGGLLALVGVSFVLGGALGNLLDRYRHGHIARVRADRRHVAHRRVDL